MWRALYHRPEAAACLGTSHGSRWCLYDSACLFLQLITSNAIQMNAVWRDSFASWMTSSDQRLVIMVVMLPFLSAGTLKCFIKRLPPAGRGNAIWEQVQTYAACVAKEYRLNECLLFNYDLSDNGIYCVLRQWKNLSCISITTSINEECHAYYIYSGMKQRKATNICIWKAENGNQLELLLDTLTVNPLNQLKWEHNARPLTKKRTEVT